MKNKVSVMEVGYFKYACCNENRLIIKAINEADILKHFISPILDVGCGIGDIAYYALASKEVVGIDVNHASLKKYPLRDNHNRFEIDFFNYESSVQIHTLFISHTLQFLDNDLNLLNNKIEKLNAQNIILIVNRNDDFMGQLIGWTKKTFKNSSPEVRYDTFPSGYKLIKNIPFTAKLECRTFIELAQQIEYLMLIKDSEFKDKIVGFLEQKLQSPEFTINQDIQIYERR